ncbi:hypothetical protein DYH09_05985, partial [bacterium CPR1]|nr:hypothetical protein [bacterium CPR1]
SDLDGDPLSLEWTTTSVVPAGEPGSYSTEGRSQMNWDPAVARWRQEWEWRPPPGAAPGTRYLLKATVSDGKGSSSDEIGATGTVEVLAPGRIAFTSNRAGAGSELYSMNPDGTDVTRITRGVDVSGVIAWSPDGARISFVSRSPGAEILMVERDGSGLTRVTDGAGWGLACESPDFTGDGTMIAFLGYAASSEVYLISLDGTDPCDPGRRAPWQLTNEAWPLGGGSSRTLAAHPDGQRLVVDGGVVAWPGELIERVVPGWKGSMTGLQGPADTYEVLYRGLPSPVVTNLTGTGTPGKAEVALSFDGERLCWGFLGEWWTYTAPPGSPGSAAPAGSVPTRETCRFSPDANHVTYQVRKPPTDCEIYSADLSGENARNLTNHPAFDDYSVWSPR